MLRKLLGIVLIGSSVLLLGGCYRHADVSLHQPGKYTGKTDPLLAKLKNPDMQKKLQERFKTGQTDR